MHIIKVLKQYPIEVEKVSPPLLRATRARVIVLMKGIKARVWFEVIYVPTFNFITL